MKGGRPTVITEEVLRKLEEAFAMGCTDIEACLYADISKTALYEYQEKNPYFAERKAELKENPVLKARTTIIKSLKDPNHAKWYLEKKKKDEFGGQPLLGDVGNINIILFNNGNHDSTQLQSGPKTIPVESTEEPISFQVLENPS